MEQVPSEIKIGTLPVAEISGAVKALEFARQIMVTDQSSYEIAAGELRDVKTRAERIEAQRVKLKAPILEAGRGIDGFFKQAAEPLLEAEKIIKSTMLTYQQAEERKAEAIQRAAEEESRKARTEAERKAREAREKADAEIRRQREEQERAQREADAAAARSRAAAEAGDREAREKADRERRDAEAQERAARASAAKAEQKGEEQAAHAMAKAAEVAARPAPVADLPQAKGVSYRSTWSARVDDLGALVKAVAEGRAPLETVMANEKVLFRMAGALKDGISKICPGVTAVEKKTLASSTA